MKRFPSIPHVENAPPELFEGHLWIQEKCDGAPFRFQMDPSGMLVFGDRERIYTDEPVPEPYRHAVRHVRERFDRDAFREAVDDAESVVFFGEAMHHHAIDYDWERTPSFLGFDVWSTERRSFLPPDAVERVFSRLGLEPINAVAQEVRAADFDPDDYEIPTSAWYDGPAEGVVLRNKNGTRAKLLHPRFRDPDEVNPIDASAEELARRYATERRVERIVRDLEAREMAVTFDAVYERVVEDLVRQEHARLDHHETTVEMGEVRSEVAALTRNHLDG